MKIISNDALQNIKY